MFRPGLWAVLSLAVLLGACAQGQLTESEDFSTRPDQSIIVYSVNASVFRKQTVSFVWREYDPVDGALLGTIRQVSKRRSADEIFGGMLVGKLAYEAHGEQDFYSVSVPAGSYLMQSFSSVSQSGNTITTTHRILDGGTIAVEAKPGQVAYLGNITVRPWGISHDAGDLPAAVEYMKTFENVTAKPYQAAYRLAPYVCEPRENVWGNKVKGSCQAGVPSPQLATAKSQVALKLDDKPYSRPSGQGYALFSLNNGDYAGQDLTLSLRQLNPANRRPVGNAHKIKAGGVYPDDKVRFADTADGTTTYFLVRLPVGKYVVQAVGGKPAGTKTHTTQILHRGTLEFDVTENSAAYLGDFHLDYEFTESKAGQKSERIEFGTNFVQTGYSDDRATELLDWFGVEGLILHRHAQRTGEIVCLRDPDYLQNIGKVDIEDLICKPQETS